MFKNPTIAPRIAFVDFETASILVIQRAFPLSTIQGCFLYLKKKVLKFVCENGLKTIYVNDPIFKGFINKFTALHI
jgi:hypothetical protein